jgi:hypothetical protein
MSRVIVVLVVLLGCRKIPSNRWDGVPTERTCTTQTTVGAATCIAGGKVYQCVESGDRMLCSRDTVEIKCTNIVNVETVCPGKP